MAYRNYSYFVGVDSLGRVAVRSDKEFAYTDQFHQISDIKDDEWETQIDIRGIDFSAYANKNLADALASFQWTPIPQEAYTILLGYLKGEL